MLAGLARPSCCLFKNALLLLVFGAFSITFLSGQQLYSLEINYQDSDSARWAKRIKVDAAPTDSLSIINQLQTIIRNFHQQGFLEASVDELTFLSPKANALIYIGQVYEWAKISNGNIEKAFLDQAGFRKKLFQGKKVAMEKMEKMEQSILDQAANKGYPFAEVWLDSIRIQNNEIGATLLMEKHELILIKDIEITGDAKVTKNYLFNYLGLEIGDPYNHAKILRVRDRLRELPFLQAKEDPIINFEDKYATVKLQLQKKKASRFDFLIGVLPDNSRNSGSLLITGTFNAELQNQFGQGEKIYIAFEQLRPETQQLDLQFNYPYILSLPFGIDAKFDLYRRDTSFLDLELDLGIQYLLEGGNYLKAFWNNTSSTLLTIDEDEILAQQQLPDQLDVSNSTFGLEYAFQKLDYRFNPTKGWNTVLRAGAGIKRIRRNNEIEALELGSLYDELALRSIQFRIEPLFEGFLPLSKRSTLMGRIRGGLILTDEPVYFNEQYRIGGSQDLRGFDEESIFATRYGIATVEYRFLLGLNSYFNIFGDYAYVEDQTTAKDQVLRPYGFGAGITFETKVGLFGMSLAFGKVEDIPIDFSAPKIHFGYVSLF